MAEKDFVVKNGVTIGGGTGNQYSLQSTDGQTGQTLITDGSGAVTWQTITFETVSGDIDGGTY